MWWLALAAGVVSALGSLSAGKRDKKALEAQAELADYDAALALQRAEVVQDVYGQREAAVRRQTDISRGGRHAAIAQSGTGFGGSNADVDAQSEVFAELDALNIRYEGQIENYNLKQEASRQQRRAAAFRSGAGDVMGPAMLGAAGSLLSGASNAYGVYKYGNTPGASSPRQYGLYGNYPSSRVG